MKDNKSSIVFVGVVGSGKTVLLSVLALRYNLRPMDADAQDFRDEVQRSLEAQKWPDKTNSKSKLMHWRLNHQGKKYPLWTRDVPGEDWYKYVRENQVPEDMALAEEFKELEEQIKKAPGLCLLLDLTPDINEGINFDQRNFVEATANLLEKNKSDVPVALVVTKCGTYGKDRDELDALVKEKYLCFFDGSAQADILFIDAVADIVSDLRNPKHFLPAENFHSEGIEKLLNWIAEKSDYKNFKAGCAAFCIVSFRFAIYIAVLWWLGFYRCVSFWVILLFVFVFTVVEILIRRFL